MILLTFVVSEVLVDIIGWVKIHIYASIEILQIYISYFLWKKTTANSAETWSLVQLAKIRGIKSYKRIKFKEGLLYF